MGLFEKKQRRSAATTLPTFGFETLPAPVAPSFAEQEIVSKQNMIKALWAVLFVLVIATLLAGNSLQAMANIEPYVVDGGVFGCPVPILNAGEL
jgi:hypothetical protein